MEKRSFGRTGFKVSVLGFGAAPAAFLDAEAARVQAMLESLLDRGMNFIDTAAAYPGSEKFLGEHLAHRRKDFVLVSKCGSKVAGLDGDAWSAALIAQSIDRSLALLKTDVIDVMLLHTCDLKTLQQGEALGALVKAREAGKIRFAGYSGDNEAGAYAAAHPEVAVVETSINIVDQANIEKVLPVARKHNVGVIAKRPVANAAWKNLDAQPGMYKNYAKVYTERLAKMKISPGELGFGSEPAKAWPEIALRFTLGQDGVSTAIIGTTNPHNADANFAAAERGPLKPEIAAAIKRAFDRANDGSWNGLT